MISIKEILLDSLKDVIDYPVVSAYPNANIVPICVIQEEANTSTYKEKNFVEIAYVEFRFILIDNDIDRLNSNINKLDEYLVDLNFSRILYNEYQTIQSCRGVTLVYSADLKVDLRNPDTIKICKTL